MQKTVTKEWRKKRIRFVCNGMTPWEVAMVMFLLYPGAPLVAGTVTGMPLVFTHGAGAGKLRARMVY